MQLFRTLLITLLLATTFYSCEDKNDNAGTSKTDKENQTVNEWMYDEMKFYYYWNNEIPSYSSLNTNREPQKLFFDLLYKYKTREGDRFSYLTNGDIPYYTKDIANTYSEASHNDLGFEYQPFLLQDDKTIEFLITYVKEGSNAKEKIKRGDWITAVDGVTLNIKNWEGIFTSRKEQYKVTVAGKGTIDLQTTPVLYENPVHTTKIIDAGSKKVGYVLYNSFKNGKDDDSYEYALKMNNEVFKSFEDKIDELILDLRYNGGGLVQSGTFIASAIAPNRSGKIYTRRNYNDNLEKIAGYKNSKNNYFYDEIDANGTKHTIPQLKLKRLYVITSKYTASASEQIINGLSAYMKVEIIGETTTGKNMESFAIDDKKDKTNKWILHPLTSVSYRSDLTADKNDYKEGFEPTIGWVRRDIEDGKIKFMLENDEFQSVREQNILYELGDPRETLLSKALDHITGATPKTMKRSAISVSFTPLRAIGSSLEGKPNLMISENPNQK